MTQSLKRFRWFLLAVFLVPLTLQAQAISIIPRDTKVAGNVVRSGERVDVDGTVEGDALLFGETVTVNGTVKGDVISFAGKVIIEGTVGGSVRAAAQDITINGKVGRNVTVAAQHVTIGSDSTIAGSLAVAGQELNFNGKVTGSLDGAVAMATISGTVGLDVNVHSNVPGRTKDSTIFVKSSAIIGGALIHTGRPVATVESGAKVTKGVTERPANDQAWAGWNRFATVWHWSMELGLIVLGLIGFWLFRRHIFTIKEEMRRGPGKNVLLGLGVLLLTPIVVPILCITLIGIPLAAVLFVLYLFALYLTKFFLALLVGEWLIKWGKQHKMKLPHSQWFALILGLLTLFVVLDVVLGTRYQGGLRILNFISSLAWAIGSLWALGAIVRGNWRELRQNG